MMTYIPDKVFTSINMCIEEVEGKWILRFTDIDINQSLVVNICTELKYDQDEPDITTESYRLPLTKSVKSVIKNFESIKIEGCMLKGYSGKKEVQLAMYSNTSEEYQFPTTAKDMLEYTMEMNDKPEVLEVEFQLTQDIMKDLYSCLSVIDNDKDTDTILGFTMSKNAGAIAIVSKDAIGNNFKYIIPDVEVEETFKVKYDKYFLSILKVLSGISIESFDCTLSNLMFGTSFKSNDISVMLAVTVFEKVK